MFCDSPSGREIVRSRYCDFRRRTPCCRSVDRFAIAFSGATIPTVTCKQSSTKIPPNFHKGLLLFGGAHPNFLLGHTLEERGRRVLSWPFANFWKRQSSPLVGRERKKNSIYF